MLLHKKKDSRDASSTSPMRYSEPGSAPGRVLRDAEQELGAHEQGLEGDLDAAVEAAGFAVPGAIELDERRDVGIADGPPIRAAHDAREDGSARSSRLRRVGGCLLGGGAADEDALAARRLARPRRLVRPADLDVTQVRPVAAFRDIEAARKRPEEWLAFAGRDRGGLVEERDRHLTPPRRDTGTRTDQFSSARLRACCSSRAHAPVHVGRRNRRRPPGAAAARWRHRA